MSAYRHQQSQRKLDGYRPQGPPPFQPRGQRPFLPKTRASSFRPGPLTRPRSPNACHTCGLVPYYQCHHFTQRQRPQGRGGAGPRQQFNRHNAIQANDADFEDEDPNFVNTISTVYDSTFMAFEIDPDVQYSTHTRDFPRDENGLPMMPNWRQTPLLYAFVRLDKRRYPNVQDRSMYYQKDTPITEVLCLPDTGCVQSVCHVDLAHEIFGIENFNRAETTNMYAANGQRLNCVGSVDAQISYFGIHCDFRVYLMEDVSKDYIVLDHHVCKYLQIIPMQFPLPIRLCNLQNMNQPNGTAAEPFAGATVQNMYKNNEPHRPMSPYNHMQFISGDAEKAVLDEDIEKASKSLVQDNAKLDISCSFNIESEKAPALVKINKLVQRYLDVFNTSLRKDIKIPPVRLRFRKDIEVVPFKCTSAPPIPFALRDAAKREIQTQVKLGIIEKVPPNEPLDWICPGMMLEKGNSRDCRLVVSAVKLNEFLDRDAFPQQSSKELVRQIPPTAKWFMTADFFKGFYQIPLHQDDQNKTAFMIHGSGLYRFKRLPQGATCSVDLFNRITDEVVAGIPNCLKLIDDILFYGPTIESVLENFTVLLDRCHERGFTLHPNKLAFGNRLKFAGYVVSDKGLEIDPKKVEAVRKYPKPVNVTDMKSFVGLATQFQEACPFLMGTLRPLIDTTSHKVTPAFDDKTKKKIKNHKRIIDWNPSLEEAFLKAKKLLTDADGTVLYPYDPSLPLTIYTDASRLEGFGWLACQTIDGARRLIECGSSTIPEAAKRNFSVIELELACVEMAMRKLKMMTIANPNVEVKTDHQAIIGVLKKPLDKIESRRLMKLAEKLHQYSFTISHVSGIRNIVADALSRNPVTKHEDDDIDTSNILTINMITDFGGQPPMNIETLRTIAEKDVDYQMIRSAILDGVLASDLPPDHPARPYKPDWHLLGTHDSLITFNDSILVPKAARKEILQMLHFAHLGQQKTTNLANQLYYWKGMSREIEQLVETCEQCQVHSNFLPKEPLQQTFARYPMEMNSVDLAEFKGKNYLIHADRYSGFLWIYHLNKTTSLDVKKALWKTFSQFGFPKHLRSDNGPQFVSDLFISECKKAGIQQEWSSPMWPIGNGHGERSVALGKSLMKKAEHPGDLEQMLMIFNATPSQCKLSPHELLQRRRLRTPLPTLDLHNGAVTQDQIDQANEIKRRHAQDKKHYYDKSAKPLPRLKINQKVRIYNNKTNCWDMVGNVVYLDQKCNRSYRIHIPSNDVYLWRNRRYLKPFVGR